MKRYFFKILAALNRIILPRYSKSDITRLSKTAKVIVAYRYWVTINSLS
jgi:hypothetical protein